MKTSRLVSILLALWVSSAAAQTPNTAQPMVPSGGGSITGYLPLSAGSGNALTGQLFTQGIRFATGQFASGFGVGTTNNDGMYSSASGNLFFEINASPLAGFASTGFTLATGSSLSWGTLGSTQDVFLARDAAGILAQVNGANAQIHRIYHDSSSANANYSRVTIDAGVSIANTFLLGSEHGGTPGAALTKFQINVDGANKLDFGVGSSNQWTSAVIFNAKGLSIFNGTGGGTSFNQTAADGVFTLVDYSGANFGRIQFGGTSNLFAAIKRVGPAVALRRADDTIGVFADLPAAASGNEGALYAISDGSTATWGATVTGGGSNHVLVRSNGSAWTVAGM